MQNISAIQNVLKQNVVYLPSDNGVLPYYNYKTTIIMAQTAMTVRMDNQQKIQFDRLCEQFGMSANTAINIFVRAVIRSKSIPFSINIKDEDEVTAKAREACNSIRAAAERGETPELTLDEINAEIREVRRLRKERNDVCSH